MGLDRAVGPQQQRLRQLQRLHPFGGQLFSGVNRYYDPETVNTGGIFAPQKTGPIPLGDECGAAGLSSDDASCPEGGLATNGDNLTQVSQAQGQLWAATSTQLAQTYTGANAEIHMGAVYWVVGTHSFDKTGKFTLTSQGYVSPGARRPGHAGHGRDAQQWRPGDHAVHAGRQRRANRR